MAGRPLSTVRKLERLATRAMTLMEQVAEVLDGLDHGRGIRLGPPTELRRQVEQFLEVVRGAVPDIYRKSTRVGGLKGERAKRWAAILAAAERAGEQLEALGSDVTDMNSWMFLLLPMKDISDELRSLAELVKQSTRITT